MSSPFSILENGSILFTQTWTETTDPNTGNPVPSIPDELLTTCYFKKVRPSTETKLGADTSTFIVSGYVIDPNPLPEWCRNSRNSCQCWIKGVGKGVFRWEPKLHVAKVLVESVTGTQIQGTVVLEGGFNETDSEL